MDGAADSNVGKCPLLGGPHRHTAAGTTANQHWWPHHLNLNMLHQNSALSDPMGEGWNLLGARELHVTASFLTHHASVVAIWYAQVAAIVAAHVIAVVVLHALAGGTASGRRAQVLSQLPLTVLMIAYTLFGLWLLSTPVAA